jgi:Na+/H+ antiporter NhaC
MPWNLVTVLISWVMVFAAVTIPTFVGVLFFETTGLILGLVVGGIILYLASDYIARYIRKGYPKTA